MAQADGGFNDVSPLASAEFRDGTSQTMLMAERALPFLRDVDPGSRGPVHERYGWTISGNWGDTLATAFFPPNLHRKLIASNRFEVAYAASSLHPGGLNVLMADGSQRFVSETISSWPIDPATGYPQGARQDDTGAWTGLPAPGVWQALSTRGGGEIVSQDGF
jgi:prepilin-type processing-associated H-X9-DG protein